jgi:hypothetical protein
VQQEARLEEDRRDHHRRLADAEPAQRDDARGRRPDASRHVLREHREHLGLHGDAIRHADPVGRQDLLPADHEEQVVDGEHGERDRDEQEVGVA